MSMEKLAAYKKGLPEIRTYCDKEGKWRFQFGFMLKDGKGLSYFDKVIAPTESYGTEQEAIEVARFCICTAWIVDEVVSNDDSK